MQTVRVAVLAFEGISLFHLSVPGVVLNGLNTTSSEFNYDVRYCAEYPGLITSDQGIQIKVVENINAMLESDIIVIPAWKENSVSVSENLVSTLQKADSQGKLIVGLCLGAFVLGEAGLLDGKEATTHWMSRDSFAEKYPNTRFKPDALYIRDGNIITSAGTVAAIDCCLQIVRDRHGADLANKTARFLVTPPHRQGGQIQYIVQPVPEISTENRLPMVIEWARENLSARLTLDKLAEVAYMSRRTFTRRFRESMGTSVTKWLNAERVSKAQQLLEITDLSIESIVSQTGFGTALSLRQQFIAQVGVSPTNYRRTFRNQIN